MTTWFPRLCPNCQESLHKRYSFGRYSFPERNLFLKGTCFRKRLVSGRSVFPNWSCARRCAFRKGTCLWKKLVFENVFGKRVISRGTCFWKKPVSGRLVLDRTPLGGSYLYMWSEVIQKAYLPNVLSGRTRDAEASRKTCFTNELSMRLRRIAKCYGSHRSWHRRSPLLLEMP